ncbi:MAG TPA: hypothetical protein VFD41_08600, partial [Actinomycetales bacterium]|nr:hypothetical protein [Actinomycetales bacterium]
GGALFGPLAAVLSQTSSLQQQAANVPPEQLEQVLDSARGTGGWAVLGVLLSLVAAAAGGLLGGRTGSRRQDAPPVG